MADTVGMTLVLKADAKGVVAEMKNAQGAVVDTARLMKSQLSGAAQAATGDLMKMKEGMGRARETAMFFTQSLTAFGPAGQTAQTALAGIGGAIIGGGGLLAGLSLAKVAVELLTEAWASEAKAAKDAADKSLAAAKSIADAAAASAAARVGELQAQLYTPQLRLRLKFQEDLKAINAKIAESNQATGDDVQSEQTKKLVAERNKLIDSYKAELNALNMLGDLKKSKDAADRAEAKAKSAKGKPVRESVGFSGYEDDGRGLDDLRKLEESDFAKGLAAAEKATKEMEAKAKRISDAYAQMAQSISESIGDAFAKMIAGSESVKNSMASMLKSIVNMVINSVKAQIMANAAATAAEGAKSQAGIPVVGPYLAAGAMVAMLAMVQGLINQIPSAAGGWERVPNDTMAMIHKDEQVLPAKYAEGLRNLVANGGGNVTINISAVDGPGVRRLLLNNSGAVAESLARAVRDGRA